MILSDPSAERAVLAGICHHGADAFYDVADMLQKTTFTIDSNMYIFECLKHLVEKQDVQTIDFPSIQMAASDLGIAHIFNNKDEVRHLQAVMNLHVNLSNIRQFAGKIRKLEVARIIHDQLGNAQDQVANLTGNENIAQILCIAEDSVLDLSNLLQDKDDAPELLGHDLEDYLEYLADNPVSQIGISTGFPVYDRCIGGGLRKGTISVIAARPKCGKTVLGINIGDYIADNLDIPVLNMDTEMLKEDHVHRTLAKRTETAIDDIETGQFGQNVYTKTKILDEAKRLKKTPSYHKSIAGKPFEEQISMMRRWLLKEVGLNDDGTAKDCVIIYDYLKLMDSQGMSNDLKEYQLLGFMMTTLHNFMVRYKVPMLALMQLNRDGITKESTDTASGSDRIIWLCSNFTIFKRKSDDEIAADKQEAGNRKLVPVVARHGEAMDDNDYINCVMKGWCSKIEEGKTRSELAGNKSDDGFEVDDDCDDETVNF